MDRDKKFSKKIIIKHKTIILNKFDVDLSFLFFFLYVCVDKERTMGTIGIRKRFGAVGRVRGDLTIASRRPFTLVISGKIVENRWSNFRN